MLQTLVLKILYLACKLCPDSSPEPEPVGASTLFVITAVILKVVRIFLLHWVDLHFIFKKPNFCCWVSAKSWPQKAWSCDRSGAQEAGGHQATLRRASPPAPEEGGPDARQGKGQTQMWAQPHLEGHLSHRAFSALVDEQG